MKKIIKKIINLIIIIVLLGIVLGGLYLAYRFFFSEWFWGIALLVVFFGLIFSSPFK